MDDGAREESSFVLSVSILMKFVFEKILTAKRLDSKKLSVFKNSNKIKKTQENHEETE